LTFSDIQDFVKKSHEETLHLEFKTVTRSDLSFRDDRKSLAIALSRFGNSDGGLVVWGVDARKNEQGN
jgi:hypothetical protein